ncbi:LLM class F420-dependent oxidoreductase [Mycolicibacterium sp. 018/SC-01/001]|uniref:LLM class F420-dependent oxidoreductase n=1 Tax=Mycolicibacterium sp. 018/SC-01/001 TaxID=2592069 RepID=UPI00117CCDF0|nr:LLM class F420-dependent oxidoreductase [Mycolicibacterium sp. 018/SC-01/001]TRW79615.1 LLM class F420-dependent oxidoreductase [Mycolicibacterium sp. 018/SC-01/001]
MRYLLTYPVQTRAGRWDLARGSAVAAIARAAEAAGFEGFGTTDHPAPPSRWLAAGGHHALDPFVSLGYAAAVTTTLRLVPNLVVLPYRNPFLVAKSAATLDVLSDGRFTLAVGVGFLRGEFAALGVDFDNRGKLVDDALRVIRAVWTSDDIRYEGSAFTAAGITAHPRPVATPHLPIWIGGNSAAARDRVARFGDGWCPFAAPAALAGATRTAPLTGLAALATAIGDLRSKCEATGRDPAEVDVVFGTFGPGPDETSYEPDAYLAEIAQLQAAGVTAVSVAVPGDSLSHAVEVIERFGEEVAAA